MRKLLSYLLALVGMAIVVSCQSESDNILNDGVSMSSQLEKDKAFIAKLGFDTSTLVNEGEVYVVEGDIVLKKESLYEYGESSGNEEIITRQAYYSGGLVKSVNVKNITVGVDASVGGNSGWYNAVINAIQAWNNVSGSAVKFSYTTSTTPSILIKKGTIDAVAQASWPLNGNPGNSVTINFNYNYYTESQKLFIMAHELGHCIGLKHTNWQILGEATGIQISGTPATDSNSVMNGVSGGTYWSGFSSYDIIAIKYLYPEIIFESIKEINNGTSVKIEAVLNISGSGPVELTMQVGLFIGPNENPEVVFNGGNGGSNIVVNKTNVSDSSNAKKMAL